MTLSTKKYLENCHELSKAGIFPTFKIGERIARGFADVGFDEYMIVPNNKFISLVTGTEAKINEQEKSYYFLVLNENDLTRYFELSKIQINQITLTNQNWTVTYALANSPLAVIIGKNLLNMLSDIAVQTLDSKKESFKLRVV